MSLLDELDNERYKPLGEGEEIALGERLEAARADQDDAAARAVRDELISRHLRLVVHIAKGYPVLDREEAFAVGCLALTQAADRWQPDRGRMYPWAERWITTALTRAADASRTIRIPQQVAYRAGLAAKRISERELELGRGLTEEEALEIHEGHTFDKHPAVVASLDVEQANADMPGARTMGDVLADPVDTHEQAELSLMRQAVLEAIVELSPLEREVIIERFGLGTDERKTLAELGAAHGVTGEAMRRVEAAALAKLRHPAALNGLWRQL